jgi:2-keto-3-deoxy-galactonokinase
MGRPDLVALYTAALATAGREARAVDGEQAFVAGALHLAELVR